MENRLLAMLKSATMTLPSPSDDSSRASSAISDAAPTLIPVRLHSAPNAPPALPSARILTPTAASVREPSPIPPPPSLQQVSLDELFKSLSTPPPPASSNSAANPLASQPTATIAMPQRTQIFTSPPRSGPTTPGSQPPAHQAKLLGMLSGSSVLSPGTASHGTLSSSTSTDISRPASVASPATREDERRNSLLDALKSPPTYSAHHSLLSEPIITHPNPPTHSSLPPRPSLPTPPVLTALQAAESVSAQQSAVSAQGPAPQSTATTHSVPKKSTPAKSIFDFVSPFDAFDSMPRSTAQTQGAAKLVPNTASVPPPTRAMEPEAVTKPAMTTSVSMSASTKNGSKSIATLPPIENGSAILASQAVVPTADADTHVPSNSTSTTPKQSPGQGSQTSSGRVRELGLPWLASKVAKDDDGQGPKALSSNTTIDLSKSNVDMLVNSPGTVQLAPTTIMKAESVGYQRGRNVAAAPGWMAYTLSRGRVRLIDRKSAARTVLQLELAITDIAATGGALAVVTVDGVVSVFRVPPSWERDDPPCPLIFRLGAIAADVVPAEKSLGVVNRTEWVRRDGPDAEATWLAIGGSDGVVIVKPSNWVDKPDADPREVLSATTVLKSNGPLVSFCLNASHQAIGLLSSSSYFALYSVAALNQVWHRQLPSSTSPTPLPSSVRFCEANIIVGRANNTIIELVQITVEIAILATVKFISPQPSPSELHFAQAEYDPSRAMLFLTPFSRGSVYAFHYSLQGVHPLAISESKEPIIAFDSVVEFPVDSVISFVVGPGGSGTEAELFISTPTGISQVVLNIAKCTSQLPGRTVSVSDAAPASAVAPSSKPAVALPARPLSTVSDLPTKRGKTKMNVSPRAGRADLPATDDVPSVGPGGLDEVFKALKKTEDRILNNLRQTVQKELSTLASRLDDNALKISASYGEHIKLALPTIIKKEIELALPDAVASIQSELRQAVDRHAPVVVQDTLQSVSREVTNALSTLVPRTITSVVQSALERTFHNSFQKSLVPALEVATDKVYGRLATDLQTEMVQIRKDICAEQGEALSATNAMIQGMATSIAELQKQLAAVAAAQIPSNPSSYLQQTHQQTQQQGQQRSQQQSQHQPLRNISRAPEAKPPPEMTDLVSLTSIPAALPQMSLPAPPVLEDAFLAALGAQTTVSTLGLLSEYATATETLFPYPPARSPLSNAVILTLLHRLALVLGDISAHYPLFPLAATWERRVAFLVDPSDPDVATFFARVAPVVIFSLQSTISKLAPDTNDVGPVTTLKQTLNEIQHKWDLLKRQDAIRRM